MDGIYAKKKTIHNSIVSEIDIFTKKQTNLKLVVKMGDVFREGCWHHFFIDLGRFWDPFWEVSGFPNRKKLIPEGSEKTFYYLILFFFNAGSWLE